MTNLTIDWEDLRERILDRYDPHELLDLMGISSTDLVDTFQDRVDPGDFSDILTEMDYE